MLNELLRYAHHLAGKRRRARGRVRAEPRRRRRLARRRRCSARRSSTPSRRRGDFAAIPLIAAALVGARRCSTSRSPRCRAAFTPACRPTCSPSCARRSSQRCVDGPLEAVEPLPPRRSAHPLRHRRAAHPDAARRRPARRAVQNVLFLVVAAVITFSLSPDARAVELRRPRRSRSSPRPRFAVRSRRGRGACARRWPTCRTSSSERLAALRAMRFHRTEREEAAAPGRRQRAAEPRGRVGFQVLDAHVDRRARPAADARARVDLRRRRPACSRPGRSASARSSRSSSTRGACSGRRRDCSGSSATCRRRA